MFIILEYQLLFSSYKLSRIDLNIDSIARELDLQGSIDKKTNVYIKGIGKGIILWGYCPLCESRKEINSIIQRDILEMHVGISPSACFWNSHLRYF